MASLTQIMAKLKPGAASSGSSNLQAILAKLKPGTPIAPTVTAPPQTPSQPQSFASTLFNGAAGAIGQGVQNIGSALTDVGTGVGAAIGKTGLGLGQAFFKGAGVIGGAMGDKPGQQFAEQNANEIGTISSDLYDKPNAATLSTPAGETGTAIGDTAAYFAPGSAEEGLMKTATDHINQLPKLLGLAGDAGEGLVGTLKSAAAKVIPSLAKIGAKSAISGASMAGITAGETGGNKSATEGGGILGALAGGVGEAISSFGKPLAQMLNKADFKLSPAAEAKASAKVEQASSFITDNKIVGSNSTKYRKLSGIVQGFENALQTSLPKTVTIAKKAIIDNINSAIETLKSSDPAIYKAAKGDADEAIDLLKSQKGSINGSINTDLALDSKRSYGAAAFRSSKASVKDPQVVSEGQYAVEQGYQKALQDTLESTNHSIQIPKELQSFFNGKTEVSLADFNKMYSKAISAKQFTNLAQFKGDSGLVGRMLSLWVGEAAGQALMPGLGGKIGGALMGEATLQHAGPILRNVGERTIEQGPAVIPGAAKVGLGVSNQ